MENNFSLKTILPQNGLVYLIKGGTRWYSWLRHYATSRKVAGSSPDEMDFFQII
jgi:hypothetical protein